MKILKKQISINKEEFLRALEITEVSNYIIEIESKYIRKITLSDLHDYIGDEELYPFDEIRYTNEEGLNVEDLGELLTKHGISHEVSEVLPVELRTK